MENETATGGSELNFCGINDGRSSLAEIDGLSPEFVVENARQAARDPGYEGVVTDHPYLIATPEEGKNDIRNSVQSKRPDNTVRRQAIQACSHRCHEGEGIVHLTEVAEICLTGVA